MEKDDVLIAIARLQVTQEALLARFDEYKTHQKEMHIDNKARMDIIEADLTDLKNKVNYAAGFMALAAIPFLVFIDWFKAKILGIGA